MTKPALRIEKIGPEEARRYLETMGRPSYLIQPAYVRWLARRMRSGAWTTEGEPIVETREGKLLSGRRRMHAVIQAGVEVEFVVQLGREADLYFARSEEERRRAKEMDETPTPEQQEVLEYLGISWRPEEGKDPWWMDEDNVLRFEDEMFRRVGHPLGLTE